MVELGLEDNAFQRGIRGAQDRLDAFGSSARRWGAGLTLGVTTPIIAAGKAFIGWSADLDESINKSNVLFGKNAAAIIQWSEGSDKAMGMSQQATLDYAASFAGMLKSVADGPDQLADYSRNLVQLTTDFASFQNLSPEEAFTVLSSGLAGEAEAVRRYGIDVSAAAVEQKALTMGLAETTAELTEQDKALARYQILLDDTAHYQGDFANTIDSTSNKGKIFEARLKTMGTAFGRQLLPFVNKGFDAFEKLFDWLEKLDPATQKWLVGIVALAAALGPMLIVLGMMASGLSVLLGLIGFLLSPIGLLVAAIAIVTALFVDWGAALEFLRDVGGPVVDFLQDIYDHFMQLINPVSDVMDQINELGGLESPEGLSILAAALETARYAFDRIRAAIGAIDWVAVLSTIGNAFLSLGQSILSGLSAIDWAAILSGLGNLAATLANWVWTQATAVDWGGLISAAAGAAGDITGVIVGRLGNLFTALFLWVWNAASAVDWGGLIGAAAAQAGDITPIITSRLGDLYVALFLWVWLAADAVPWGALISAAAAKAGDITPAIISSIGNLGTALDTWLREALAVPNWAGIGETIGASVGDLSQTLTAKAGQMLQGFLTAIVEPGFWSGTGTALLAMIATLPASLSGYVGTLLAEPARQFIQGFLIGLDTNWYTVAMWMLLFPQRILSTIGSSLAVILLPKGIELLQGFLNGLNQQWPTIAAWLLLVPAMVLASVPSLLSTIQSKGVELIIGFLAGMLATWPTVATYLANRGTQAFSHVGSLVSTLVTRGTELISGFLTGAVDQWGGKVLGWLQQRGTQAFSHVGSLSSTLVSRGIEMISGFINGLQIRWNIASAWLSSIRGKAVNAVGSLAGVLVSAGASLIQGLINGINSKIGALQSALGNITSMIPDWKGPPVRDANLLVANGLLIMQGLSRGLDIGWGDVERQLRGYTADIDGSAAIHVPDLSHVTGGYRTDLDERPTTDAQRPIVQIITLEPGKWKEFLEDATAGGDFARRFGPELAAYGGQS